MAISMSVQDANGKDFDIDIVKIFDINGDVNPNANISDSVLRNRVHFTHDTQIVDAKGQILDSTQLLKDINSGAVNVVAIDVDTEATHSGKNHNYCIYYEDSMEKDSESFMNPFHKPMLKNHDSYSEPLGRVIQSYAGPSELTDERSAIHLKVRVTDQDAIPKFIDKRYGTVSIGGSMGTVTCNICGKTILKDGKFHFCGHMRGETYKDQICYWGAKDIEYHEVSVVNNPADDFAQIMKVTVLTDKDIQKDNKKEESSMNGTDNAEQNVDDIIDATLETSTEEVKDSVETNNENTETQDSQNSNETSEDANDNVEDTNTEDSQSSETEDSNESDADLEDNQENNDDVQDENKESENSETQDLNDQAEQQVNDELEKAKAKIEELEQDSIDAQSQIEQLKKALEDSKVEVKTYKERCVALATTNKEYVVDGIISKESFETEDKKIERKKDLMVKSMKELKTIVAESTVKVRDLAHVDNPCLATEPKDSVSNSTNTADTDINDSKSIKSVDDAAQQIISKIIK